jgi:hypothetical protein
MMAITRRELKRTVSPVDHDNESPVDHNDDSPVDHANPVDHDGIPVNNDTYDGIPVNNDTSHHKRPCLSDKKSKNGASSRDSRVVFHGRTVFNMESHKVINWGSLLDVTHTR